APPSSPHRPPRSPSFPRAARRTHTPPLSLHDALPTSRLRKTPGNDSLASPVANLRKEEIRRVISIVAGQDTVQIAGRIRKFLDRSEEHPSELQSLTHLLCRLLLEKKKHTQTDLQLDPF